MRAQSKFKGFWTFHMFQHFLSSSDLLSPRRLSLPEPTAAITAQQEAPPAQLAPLRAQLWLADHDSQLAQLSRHHAQQLPLQLLHQRLLRSPLCWSHQVTFLLPWWYSLRFFSNWTWTLRKPVMLTGSVKFQLSGANLITEKSLHSSSLWCLYFNVIIIIFVSVSCKSPNCI